MRQKKNEEEFNEIIKYSEKSENLGITLEEFILMFLGYSPRNKVEGKTRFQKLIYLLNKHHNIFPNLKYTRYYYGPYSNELEEAINNLKRIGYINEKIIYFGPSFYYYQINRNLTESGYKKFKDLESRYVKVAEKIKKMIKSTLSSKNYFDMELSELLKIVYKEAGYI
ncbi:MAG: hypothetical protein ACTSRP_10200 [Candidatus Helarchaeota archaeon]